MHIIVRFGEINLQVELKMNPNNQRLRIIAVQFGDQNRQSKGPFLHGT